MKNRKEVREMRNKVTYVLVDVFDGENVAIVEKEDRHFINLGGLKDVEKFLWINNELVKYNILNDIQIGITERMKRVLENAGYNTDYSNIKICPDW
jgi:hypothetical protein